MVARSRGSARGGPDIWPGFVDALSSLLLVLIFLLVVFVLSEFLLSRALSGRDEALMRLNQQVSELADLLSLERQSNTQLRGDITQLAAQLQASTAERDGLASRVALLVSQQGELEKQLAAAGLDAESLESAREDLQLQLAAAMAMLEAERATLRNERDKTAADHLRLVEEQKISSAAQRQLTLLNQQIASLRLQLAGLQNALDARDAELSDKNIQIADLGQRLNVALATKVEELSRYRSEFFGRLREVLGSRSDVSIEGDRFVIQSGVLFDTGRADLGPAGEQQLGELAELLLQIASEIPSDLKWILRIDGHTDKRPIKTFEFPSNWELSAARAIAVARYLAARGVPPDRLTAAGFGEFQPLDQGETELAYRRNRRIELKLTER
ncbi:MAG: peptidoglycan -binding protein [Alphaproteobacteria bacterium]|jgi:chemotaxis protein MotB|nr:peptidoglycan -binding protein [Alphaproteobacteria bacterium]MDP6517682.1 peptidoglycan -binding protein [Alphaproteobacteria bacterium]